MTVGVGGRVEVAAEGVVMVVASPPVVGFAVDLAVVVVSLVDESVVVDDEDVVDDEVEVDLLTEGIADEGA